MNRPDTKKLLALGEFMIELSHLDTNLLKMGFAGDTLNTAIYLARYHTQSQLSIYYGTALGCDPYSQQMLNFLEHEKINTEFTWQIPGKLPGLYLIKTDNKGERTFYFYRSDSAARQFFHACDFNQLKENFLNMDIIFFSGIGLAIWDEFSHTQLFELIQKAREKGTLICFDSNYRNTLWPNKAKAQQLIKKAWEHSHIYLPTFEDHQLLFGDTSPETLIAELTLNKNLKEIVVKAGARGCWVAHEGKTTWIPACHTDNIVDTTGAGDSFNAAYLTARMQGACPENAARFGHQLASRVINFQGAIIPEMAMPPYPNFQKKP